jgi:hypothetical protein
MTVLRPGGVLLPVFTGALSAAAMFALATIMEVLQNVTFAFLGRE